MNITNEHLLESVYEIKSILNNNRTTNQNITEKNCLEIGKKKRLKNPTHRVDSSKK